MRLVIDIPDEQIKKSLEESKYIHEDDGEKGSVTITMLYTNAQLDFVDVERDEDFYSCDYKVLPKGHGRLIDADSFKETLDYYIREAGWSQEHNESLRWCKDEFIDSEITIIEADRETQNDI